MDFNNDDMLPSDTENEFVGAFGISDSSESFSTAWNVTTRDNSQSSDATLSTSIPGNESVSNYAVAAASYHDPNSWTFFTPMNGLNNNPIHDTDFNADAAAVDAHIADDRNVASYQEITTSVDFSDIPQYSPFSVVIEHSHLEMPTYGGLPYLPPPPINPLSAYAINNSESQNPSFLPSLVAAPPSFQSAIHSYPLPTPASPPQCQPTTDISAHTVLEDDKMVVAQQQQQPKKNGHKELYEIATARALVPAEDIDVEQQAKKRERKLASAADAQEMVFGDNARIANTHPASGGNTVKDEKCMRNCKTDFDQTANDDNSISPPLSEIKKEDPRKLREPPITAATEKPENDDKASKKKVAKKRPRVKVEAKSEAAGDTAQSDVDTPSPQRKVSAAKKRRMEELRLSRSPMAFPKGSFLIRYSDLETLDCDQIWCVDNHHLLLKYRLSSHIEGKRRLYLKSQPERFVGWKCAEPWHFYQLTVVERDRTGSKVTVIYPDARELAESRERAMQRKMLAEEMKSESGKSHDSFASVAKQSTILGQPPKPKVSFSSGSGYTAVDDVFQKPISLEEISSMNLLEEDSGNNNNGSSGQFGGDGGGGELPMEASKEAANAIERFILISEDGQEYSEMDDDSMQVAGPSTVFF